MYSGQWSLYFIDCASQTRTLPTFTLAGSDFPVQPENYILPTVSEIASGALRTGLR